MQIVWSWENDPREALQILSKACSAVLHSCLLWAYQKYIFLLLFKWMERSSIWKERIVTCPVCSNKQWNCLLPNKNKNWQFVKKKKKKEEEKKKKNRKHKVLDCVWGADWYFQTYYDPKGKVCLGFHSISEKILLWKTCYTLAKSFSNSNSSYYLLKAFGLTEQQWMRWKLTSW